MTERENIDHQRDQERRQDVEKPIKRIAKAGNIDVTPEP
jgi:hypothetical protein